MDKQTVVKIIGEQRMVEEIISSIAGNNDSDLDDLIQDIYFSLLCKDEDKIVKMYETKQLRFYVTRMCLNNIISKTSPYYVTYKKNKNKEDNIDDYANKI